LLWRDAGDKRLSAADALEIYALKTAPAFDAALYAGIRLAVDPQEYEEALVGFSRHLGVGFQILNDLKDWSGDEHNKLIAGQDAFAMRPTLVLALALDAADAADRSALLSMLELNRDRCDRAEAQQQALRLRGIYDRGNVFEKAERLVEKSRQRAEEISDNVQPDSFRQLLYFLVDTVLAPETQSASESPVVIVPGPLPREKVSDTVSDPDERAGRVRVAR
jgi:geranylgeranyl pyrophosphate synthase